MGKKGPDASTGRGLAADKEEQKRLDLGTGGGDQHCLLSCDRVSSERYQAFIENISDGVYEVDILGNFLYSNNSLCKVFGYPKEEIQFQKFSKFMSGAYSDIAARTFRRLYQTGQAVSDLVWEFIDKNGQQRIVELSASQIVDDAGKVVGFRGIARDVTSRFKIQKALQESERRYKTLLDFVPHPIAVFSLDGRVSYLNPAFTQIFGWTLEELKGKKIPYVPPGLEQETSENIKRLFQEKIILRQETQRLTKDDRILDVVFRAAVFSENEDGPSGELILLRDITQEKRIRRNNEALLETSLALHRRPHLDDLLDFIGAKIKILVDKDVFKEILPSPFVAETLEAIRPRFGHREIHVESCLEPTRAIRIPEDPLRKMVVGLVKNAVENTPDEGRIAIECRERGNGAELVVQDYGVGITLENQRRIFEGFFVTQETMDYSTKREFDFNAGGKGADLLRMKIFSERYHFRIDMNSVRCRYIPRDSDLCPGRISLCRFCTQPADCHASGGTLFTVFFPFGASPAESAGPMGLNRPEDGTRDGRESGSAVQPAKRKA